MNNLMAMPTTFVTLTEDEMFLIDGGINLGYVGTGLGILSATMIGIACAPATAFVGAAYGAMLIGSAAGGAAAGIFVGAGLADHQ